MNHRQLDVEVRVVRALAHGGGERSAGGRVLLELELEAAERSEESWVVGVNLDCQAKEIAGGQPVFAGVVCVRETKSGGKQSR